MVQHSESAYGSNDDGGLQIAITWLIGVQEPLDELSGLYFRPGLMKAPF